MTLEHEQSKYQRMWSHAEYRKMAPGEYLVEDAIEQLGIEAGASVIDFGCGTGRAAQRFVSLGFNVIGIDIAENCLDEGVEIPMLVHCLWDPCPVSGDAGFCTDVMEHIPTDRVEDVLGSIASAVPAAYFQIATFPDSMGRLIGDTLHLTVRGVDWWRERLEAHFRDVRVSEKGRNVIAACRSE